MDWRGFYLRQFMIPFLSLDAADPAIEPREHVTHSLSHPGQVLVHGISFSSLSKIALRSFIAVVSPIGQNERI